HRGKAVPENIWFKDPGPAHASAMAGNLAGQNAPSGKVAMAALPNDPFSQFLVEPAAIRVQSTAALPGKAESSTQATESTYGLMMHASQALGVNCTFCHNSRSFQQWDGSTPQRVTAWHGIRMARDLNNTYLTPLAATLPPERHGPSGDGPKLNCATCHQGAYKPLYGAPMAKDFRELSGVSVAVVADGLPPTEGSATGAKLYFAVGSADLAGDAAKGMEQLVASLKANPASQAVISGFHSAAGDLAQNQDLAKRRAFAVRDALKAAGI
ncbi:MAG: photosynthetic reaction center cytochrome PufC, partial [Rhizobacter sp.]